MKRVLWVTLAALLATSGLTAAFGLDSVSLGIHLTPSIERILERRSWDLSLSISGIVALNATNSVECTVVVDSTPTTLGTIAEYRCDATAHFSVGAGVAVLWPFARDQSLQAPILESFARARVHGALLPSLRGDLGISLPVVTIAHSGTAWRIMPLASLPALAAGLTLVPTSSAELEARLTLQPVIVDTTAFDDPIGRLTDDLLVLPTGSIYLRYFP